MTGSSETQGLTLDTMKEILQEIEAIRTSMDKMHLDAVECVQIADRMIERLDRILATGDATLRYLAQRRKGNT